MRVVKMIKFRYFLSLDKGIIAEIACDLAKEAIIF